MAGPQHRVGIRVVGEWTRRRGIGPSSTQSRHPSGATALYDAGKAGWPPRAISTTSLSDMIISPGHIADQLEMARHRLDLLMSGADEARNGSAWLALNDAAHCVQRALVALGSIGIRGSARC